MEWYVIRHNVIKINSDNYPLMIELKNNVCCCRTFCALRERVNVDVVDEQLRSDSGLIRSKSC